MGSNAVNDINDFNSKWKVQESLGMSVSEGYFLRKTISLFKNTNLVKASSEFTPTTQNGFTATA